MQTEDNELFCSSCDGSGEGPYDGARCYPCKGTGRAGYRETMEDMAAFIADQKRQEIKDRDL